MFSFIWKDKGLRKLLFLAILLRVAVIPFFYHPDIKTYNFQSSFLRQGVVNIYPFLISHKGQLPLKEEFVYFPLTYFFVGGYQLLASPFLGSGFNQWLGNADQSSVGTSGIYRYLFVLKLPYLVLDIGLAFLLTGFFNSVVNKRKAFLFWLFNPFSIILLYVFSNVDIYPVFLSVWSLLAIRQKKFVLSALLLGIAAGFKAYPMLFLPFLLLETDSWKERIFMVLASLGIFGLILAPFYSPSFVSSALVSGLTNRLIESAIPLGFGENIIITIFLMAGLFFWLMDRGRKSLDLGAIYILVLVILFSFIHFNIQWLLWVMPFVVLQLVRNRNLFAIFLTLGVISFLIPFMYNDNSMSVALLSVINPLYNGLPNPYTIVQKVYDPLIIQSVLHTVLAAGGFYLAFKLIREEIHERVD